MLWNLYLRGGVVYVPTVAETEAGVFLDIEPVELAPVTDTEAVRRAVKYAFDRGNPKIPTPIRATFPKPVVLKYGKLKSWSAFERGCTNWTIVETNGSYQIKQGRKLADRGWEDDPAQIEILPSGIRVDEVVSRVAASVQSAASKK